MSTKSQLNNNRVAIRSHDNNTKALIYGEKPLESSYAKTNMV